MFTFFKELIVGALVFFGVVAPSPMLTIPSVEVAAVAPAIVETKQDTPPVAVDSEQQETPEEQAKPTPSSISPSANTAPDIVPPATPTPQTTIAIPPTALSVETEKQKKERAYKLAQCDSDYEEGVANAENNTGLQSYDSIEAKIAELQKAVKEKQATIQKINEERDTALLNARHDIEFYLANTSIDAETRAAKINAAEALIRQITANTDSDYQSMQTIQKEVKALKEEIPSYEKARNDIDRIVSRIKSVYEACKNLYEDTE